MNRSTFFRGVMLAWTLASGISFAATAAAPAPAVASVPELQSRLEAHVTQPRFNGALWSVKIASLDTGRTLFEHHADRLMSPASNSKLYTGALALEVLGPEYRIVTPIFGTAKLDANGLLRGDLIVSGRGDPSWKSPLRREDFWDIFDPFLATLEKAGVRAITGDVIADATYFQSQPNGAGWTADDLNDDYGAEISAITLEDNYAELRIAPGKAAGQPCVVSLIQPLTDLKLDNRMLTGAAGTEKQIVTRRIFGETTVHVFGRMPMGAEEQVMEVTVPKPAGWFARALKAALIRRGIVVGGTARSLRWPEPTAVKAGAIRLGEVISPSMRELVTGFMKPSQNLETDLIFGHIGESKRQANTPAWRSSEELAVPVLRSFLRDHKLPADDVRFEEGSGLSRNNLTSANATVALLTFMATHPAGEAFKASLPIAGVDGTLKRRMQGTPAEGNVRAKTGSLRYANSLSGYVTSAAGEKLVFSLMLNRNAQQPAGRNVREELDDIAVMLAGLAGRSESRTENR